ncbi:hypothetical protein [Novosphingobium sp. Chol11]|uniref:hypothetical protein n=1 Tax=Novosphingobium sp. Chol11 TaxID=1385763 RepID=UPI0025D8AF98|nr:hypothetical protein [Novosphingobium sp. Chol11]
MTSDILTSANAPLGAAATQAHPADFGRAVARRVLIVWLVLVLMLVSVNLNTIRNYQFGDPDDALRLVQVRDLLAGQGWFDLHQYRATAPEGVLMHWSRLVDIPIAGIILLLRPLVGVAGAEMAALIAVPLLTLLAMLSLVGRLAARFFDAEVVGIACLISSITGPVLFQFVPLRIDHHAWQIVLAMAAVCCLTDRSAWRGGLGIGVALAALMAISIEGLPLAAVFLAICSLRGLRAPETRFSWLMAAASGLAGASALFFLGTRGLVDLANHCDAISPVHLAAFAAGAAGVAALRIVCPRQLWMQLAALGAIGAAAAAILLIGAPQCGTGAFAELDPLVRKYWYNAIFEGQPVWRFPMGEAATMILVPLFGLFATFVHGRRARDAQTKAFWQDYFILLTGAYAVGLIVARATGTTCVLSAVPIAALVRDWIVALRPVALPKRLVGFVGIAFLLQPALPFLGWELARAAVLPKAAPMAGGVLGRLGKERCNFARAGQLLDRLPATDILAPIDMGPHVLVWSHHRVVVTGHHRGSAGIHDVLLAFLSPPAKAEPIVRARHAKLIVLCPYLKELDVYRRSAPNGLMSRLLEDKPPAWLVPVDLMPGTRLRAWRVVEPKAALN